MAKVDYKDGWFKQLSPESKKMLMALDDRAFMVIDQRPYQVKTWIDDQMLSLPYTNGFCQVLLQKVEDRWHYVCRWAKEDSEPESLKAFDALRKGLPTLGFLPDWDFAIVTVQSAEDNILGKVAVYGQGKIMPPTRACQLVIGIEGHSRAFWEVARIY